MNNLQSDELVIQRIKVLNWVIKFFLFIFLILFEIILLKCTIDNNNKNDKLQEIVKKIIK